MTVHFSPGNNTTPVVQVPLKVHRKGLAWLLSDNIVIGLVPVFAYSIETCLDDVSEPLKTTGSALLPVPLPPTTATLYNES